MNNNYNELLNKIVDNELSSEEKISVNDLLKKDEEFKSKLKTHKFVHNSLFDLPVVQAPLEITSKIMGQIVSNISKKYEKHYFFRVVLAIFGIAFLTSIMMFVFYSFNIPNSSDTLGLLDSVKPYTKNIIPQLSKIFKSDLVKSIGGLISFIILLAFYFSINEHKNFKERLKQF